MTDHAARAREIGARWDIIDLRDKFENDIISLCRDVEAESYRAGIASTRPTPYTKSLCDLCQEPIAGKPGDEWRWVEEGWSIACVKCWGIIAKQVEVEALERAAQRAKQWVIDMGGYDDEDPDNLAAAIRAMKK